MVKDATPFFAISGGTFLTLTPTFIFQLIGAVGIIAGILLGYLRWIESKRANDLKEKELEFNIAKSKDSTQASEKESTNFRQGEEAK